MMGKKRLVSVGVLLVLLLILSGGTTKSGHERAKEIGLNYSDEVFKAGVTGTRKLGEDENYNILGKIKWVKKVVKLGEDFELKRRGIILLRGKLTRKDKDNLVFQGYYEGKDNLGREVKTEINAIIPMAIHGGTLYLYNQNVKAKARSSALGPNDYLMIDKVEIGKSE